jgi:hypothetical protein
MFKIEKLFLLSIIFSFVSSVVVVENNITLDCGKVVNVAMHKNPDETFYLCVDGVRVKSRLVNSGSPFVIMTNDGVVVNENGCLKMEKHSESETRIYFKDSGAIGVVLHYHSNMLHFYVRRDPILLQDLGLYAYLMIDHENLLFRCCSENHLSHNCMMKAATTMETKTGGIKLPRNPKKNLVKNYGFGSLLYDILLFCKFQYSQH